MNIGVAIRSNAQPLREHIKMEETLFNLNGNIFNLFNVLSFISKIKLENLCLIGIVILDGRRFNE
ncbi:hypothetical protein [Rummeliibacillus stabekisii]|uniref:hypothetical protein n=1 Tax=Rummeliibacillus stabekisii TaxID=241244 RepID=UPI00203E0239|nr:hypothetical protein [Rummeliibacillus stabekisii]